MNLTEQTQIQPESLRGVPIAKITRPKASDVVPRNRLFRILDFSLKHPVTWISAPAGFGKTTLVCDYLSFKKTPCIWYRVDAGDSDMAAFFFLWGLRSKKPPRAEKLRFLL